MWIVLGLLFILLIDGISATKETTREYCAFESFSPQCSNNQVVVMTTATYGRMRLGKCVKTDHGFLGCKDDVLDYFDKHCSGRRSCEISVHNAELNTRVSSCLGEISAYLEAGFYCQKVYLPETSLCDQVHHITAPPSKVDYLASLTTKETLCGLHNTPFIISAKPGQKIKLSLIDFSWQNNADLPTTSPSTCQMNYGYIVDMATNDFTAICGGVQKRHELYTSTGNCVQIVMDSMSIQSHNFLVKYEVLGCPDITIPASAWMTRANDTLTIGCHNSEDRWRLTCMNSIWLGYLGNCTAASGIDVVKVEEQTEGDSESVTSFNQNHVLAFTLGCVTLIVCITTVVVGFYFIKRYDSRRTSDTPTLHYDDATILSGRCMSGFHPVHSSTLQGRGPLPQLENPSCTLPMLHKNPPLIPHRSNAYNSNTVGRCHALQYQTQTEASNFQFFSTGNQPEGTNLCLHHAGSQYIPQSQSNYFPPTNEAAGNNDCLMDVFDDVDVNKNSNKEATAKLEGPRPHYFVLEHRPRESVTSDTEQLYQSIHYKSTDHITS